MARHRLQHEAQRDTAWVGKGGGPIWLLLGTVVVGLIAVAALLAG